MLIRMVTKIAYWYNECDKECLKRRSQLATAVKPTKHVWAEGQLRVVLSNAMQIWLLKMKKHSIWGPPFSAGWVDPPLTNVEPNISARANNMSKEVRLSTITNPPYTNDMDKNNSIPKMMMKNGAIARTNMMYDMKLVRAWWVTLHLRMEPKVLVRGHHWASPI